MRSSNLIIFTLAVFLGFLAPSFGIAIKNTLIFQLIFLMTFSLKQVDIKKLKKTEKDKFIQNLIASQITLLIIPISYFIFLNQNYINGIILWAITPPALGIVTLSRLAKTNVKETTVNETIQYLFYLIWMPFLALILLGKSISVFELFKQILYLITVPFILSRFIRFYNNRSFDDAAIRLSFAAVFYTLVSINSAKIISDRFDMAIILTLFLIQKFGTFFAARKFAKARKYDRTDELNLTLFSTIKSGGFTATLAVLLLNSDATFPITIEMITYIIFIIFVDYFYKNH